MKRILLLLSIFTIIGLVAALNRSTAQQTTTTDEVSIALLPVPTNVIGTQVRGASNDGKRLVFDSINDYNGRNVDSNREIWVYDVDTRSIIQITDTADLKDPADATKTIARINSETPVISGDGTKIAFVSNAALGGTNNDDLNYEVYVASLPRNATQATISRITDTGKDSDTEVVKEIFSNYTPAISDNGSVIAFVSTRRTFKAIEGGAQAFSAAKEGATNTDPDGNGEIFTYNTATRTYSQATVTRDVDATVNFVVRGFNSNPFLSGDGRTLAFLSGFNFPGARANKNTDFNGEIYVYKLSDPANTVLQVTDTTGGPAVPANGVMNALIAFTHPLSADGTKLVFESGGDFAGKNSEKLREVYLADLSGATLAFTQITDQTTVDFAKNDFNYLPSINSTGKFITFSSVLNLTPATTSGIKTDNADGSREVFRYDITNNKFRQITFTDLSGLVLDQRANTTSAFVDETGTAISFTYDQVLLAASGAALQDVFQAYVRPVTMMNTVAPALANAASYDATQVARGSIVAAFGTQLANATVLTPNANLPFQLGGVTVTINGIAARLIFVSPGQINFVVPDIVGAGDAVDYTINNNGILSTGKVKLVNFAPGVFTTTGDGKGKTAAQCFRVSPDGLTAIVTSPPCTIGNAANFDTLVIYGTGWHNSASISVKIGDQTFTPSYAGVQSEFLGLDQINITLSTVLANKADQEITVSAVSTTNVDSNKSTASFAGTDPVVTISNAASFEQGTVARGSLAVAQGEMLSNTTATPADFPLELNGVKVTVAGIAARLSYISPTQINFVLPNELTPADLVEVVVNNNGMISRGRVKVLTASPALLTTTGDGAGRALVKCGRVNTDGSIVFTDPPCSVGTEANPNIIRVFGTGWRNADKVVLKIGTVELTNTFAGGQPSGSGTTPGIDIIDAKLTPALAGMTDLDVVVTTTVGTLNAASKTGIKVSFTSN